MKVRNRIKRVRLLITTLIISVIVGSCVDDTPDTSSRDAFIVSIAKTWEVTEGSEIIIDDDDITHLLLGFQITINEDLTFTTNSDQLQLEEFPWPTSGIFTLNDELTEIVRNDGLTITIEVPEQENELSMEYIVSEGTGRALGIRGKHKCKFRRR